MITKQVYKDVTWIDISQPSHEEVRNIITEYHINANIGRDMLLPNQKSQIFDYRDLIYLVLHFPTRNKNEKNVATTEEVDFLIGKKLLVTIHYKPVEAIEQFAKYFEVSTILANQDIPHAGYVFFEMLKQLYSTVKNRVDNIEDELLSIEPKVFHGMEKTVVNDLSALNHTLLNFRQIIDPQREILETLAAYTEYMFGEEFKKVSHTLISEHTKVSKEIQYKKETLQELRETNDTLLSTKQNEIMKNLTMVSFITFPLSLIVALFDLFRNLKAEDGSSTDFWILIAILTLAIILMTAYFKKKRWI